VVGLCRDTFWQKCVHRVFSTPIFSPSHRNRNSTRPMPSLWLRQGQSDLFGIYFCGSSKHWSTVLFSLCLKYCRLRIQSAFKRKASPRWSFVFLIRYLAILMDLTYPWIQLILTQVKSMWLPTAFPNPVYQFLYSIGTFTNLKGRLPYKQEYNGKWTMEVSRVMMECGCVHIFFFLISFVSPLFSWTVVF
jgi:hypothetical protein